MRSRDVRQILDEIVLVGRVDQGQPRCIEGRVELALDHRIEIERPDSVTSGLRSSIDCGCCSWQMLAAVKGQCKVSRR